MDCGFYKIVSPADARDYWAECRAAAERIRDAYDRAVEEQYALRLAQRLEEQKKSAACLSADAPAQPADDP